MWRRLWNRILLAYGRLLLKLGRRFHWTLKSTGWLAVSLLIYLFIMFMFPPLVLMTILVGIVSVKAILVALRTDQHATD
jgi:hypothetical protein